MSRATSVPLSDERFFSFISGLWKGKNPPFQTAAVLRSTNFRGDGLFDYDDIALLEVEARQLDSRELRRGDIVIERSGGGPKQPVGRVAYFDPPDDLRYATSNFTTALRVTDQSVFDPEYVCLVLHSLYLSGATTPLQRATTGIRNLDWSEYKSFAIPKLAIEDQKSLATFIKKVQEGSIVEDSQISFVEQLRRAAMHDLFTKGLRGESQKEIDIGLIPESWNPTPAAQIFKLTSGKTRPDSLSPNPTTDKPYPVLGGNGTMGYSSDWNFEADQTLVIGRVGEYCGATYLAVGKIWITDNALFAKDWLDPLANIGFVAAFLQYFDLNRFKRMAGQPLVTQGMINEHSFPLPDPDEQREIVEILNAIDRKIDLHRRKRLVLESLFKALLHKLMTGELRATDLDLSMLAKAPIDGVAA